MKKTSSLRIIILLFALAAIPTVQAADEKTVRDFGAVGDGVADDTAAFQRAFDSGTGTIGLPGGTYRISRPLEVDLDKFGPVSITGSGTARLLMVGRGPVIRLIGSHSRTAAPTTVEERVWKRQRMPMLDGFEIVGGNDHAEGVQLTGTMQATITRLLIRSTLHAIRLVGRNRNVVISECHLYDNRGIGVFLDRAELHQINISNCHISYNRGGGIVSLKSVIRNLQVGTSDIEDNIGPEAETPSNILIDAREGSVVEGAVVGCTIQHAPGPARRQLVRQETANIRFLGGSRETSDRAGNFTIADNVMSDVGVNVHLENARGVVVSGNTFWQAARYNLLVDGCSNILVGPNLFDRSPLYKSDDPNGILLKNSEQCTLSGLHVNGGLGGPAGLVLENCRLVNVSGCTLLDNEGAGIFLVNCRNCAVTGCLVRGKPGPNGKSTAIRSTGGQANTVSGNFVEGQIEVTGGGTEVKANTIMRGSR